MIFYFDRKSKNNEMKYIFKVYMKLRYSKIMHKNWNIILKDFSCWSVSQDIILIKSLEKFIFLRFISEHNIFLLLISRLHTNISIKRVTDMCYDNMTKNIYKHVLQNMKHALYNKNKRSVMSNMEYSNFILK